MSRPRWSLPRLGLALLALTAAGWLTGLPYLVTRLGLPPGLPLSRVDGPHLYVGLALALLVLAKVGEVGLRVHVPRLQAVQVWQRWLSFGLVGLYGTVLASGLVLLLPLPATARTQLVNLHLLSAVWAGAATLPHVAVYLRRRLPAGVVDLNLAAALGALLVPALALAAIPVALAPSTQLREGGAWTPVGPANNALFRILGLPGGRLLSAGEGVWLSDDAGLTWKPVDGAGDQFQLALAAGPGGVPVYVGGTGGLLRAASAGEPFTAVKIPTRAVDAVFVDADGSLWIGGAGIWRSADAGATWTRDSAGVVARGSVWAFTRYGGALFAATSTGVYVLRGATWQRSVDLPEVVSLDVDGATLWATSMGGGLGRLAGGRWQLLNSGLAAHGRGGKVHVAAFADAGGGRAYAGTMDEGLFESLDGGASWYSVSAGFRPGTVWQLQTVPRGLLAATATGLYLYRPPAAPAIPQLWWPLLLGALIVGGGAALRIGLRAAAPPTPRPVESYPPAA